MLLTDLDNAIARTQAHLLSLRNEKGHWEGELSSSALSTATAVVALKLVDAAKHADFIEKGAAWLRQHQNTDGGWGDTTISKSNLSTTLLCWSALHLVGTSSPAAESKNSFPSHQKAAGTSKSTSSTHKQNSSKKNS